MFATWHTAYPSTASQRYLRTSTDPSIWTFNQSMPFEESCSPGLQSRGGDLRRDTSPMVGSEGRVGALGSGEVTGGVVTWEREGTNESNGRHGVRLSGCTPSHSSSWDRPGPVSLAVPPTPSPLYFSRTLPCSSFATRREPHKRG